MKRICAFLATAVLCLSAITVSYAAAPSFSATKWCTPPTGFGGGSRVIPSDTIVTQFQDPGAGAAASSVLRSAPRPPII